MPSPTDVLTGTLETTLETAGGDVIDLAVDVIYSAFQFMLDLVVANAGIVAFVLIVLVLWGFIRKKQSRAMRVG